MQQEKNEAKLDATKENLKLNLMQKCKKLNSNFQHYFALYLMFRDSQGAMNYKWYTEITASKIRIK